MEYSNSYARKGYQLALFGACHEYEVSWPLVSVRKKGAQRPQASSQQS